ncbi:putrescine ABC transporter permease PotH [Chromatiales bacterium (ex Bugula neritina AB1)]|nr:putrescine ABC transporter permease PotH [Chromatiales bacterium (ex Bugula neritina AB1)]
MTTPATHTDQQALENNSAPARLSRFLQRHWKSLIVVVPFAWLLVFFLTPFFIVLKISVAEALIASPPFSALLEWGDGLLPSVAINTENYAYLWEDSLYVKTYLNSLKIASISTIICLLIGYPMAYGIIRTQGTAKFVLLLLIMLPFWTSFLLRVYSWMGLLADQGTINDILLWLGLIEKPVRLLYTEVAVYIGIVYTYLPFMILPLYANMEKLDFSLNEAAADLGARPASVFATVTLPMTWPGIVAGSLLVFIPATGEFVIPDLLGGGNVLMIGRVLSSEFNANRDWPVASAVAVALLFVLLIPMMLYHRVQAQKEG